MKNSSFAILLATYNGANYLQEQLNSIANQLYTHWVIYACDDGSSDNTMEILEQFKERFPEKIYISQSNQQGASRNFLSLAENIEIKSDYYAFCDQDDIWLPEKLAKAKTLLNEFNPNIAASYFSRSILVDKFGKPYGITQNYNKQPSFRNALVQNIAAGNTAVFNHATKILFEKTKDSLPVIHDWWLYLLVSAVDGQIILDKNSYIHYRQHDSNVIGQKSGMRLFVLRVKRIFNNSVKKNNQINAAALLKASQFIDFNANNATIQQFAKSLNTNLRIRIRQHIKLRLYRQTLFGNLSLWVAIFTNKF